MTTTAAKATFEVMRSMFASYGLPKVMISDNGPQFVSKDFETFWK